MKKTDKDVRRRKKRNTRRPARPPRRLIMTNRKKLFIAFAVICALLFVLIARLVFINATSKDKYTKRVLSQLQYDSTTIPYRRGDITDRNGTVIATSEKVYNLIIDPYVITNSLVKKEGDCVDPTVEVLNEYFDIETSEVKRILSEKEDSRYIIMLKQLSYDDVIDFKTLMASKEKEITEKTQYIKGIWFEEEYVRKYPYDTLACSIIGFTAAGDVGTWGIEQYYNNTLNGTDGREYGYLTDDNGLTRTTISAINGNNIVSTIDINIQRIAEKEIANYMETVGGEKVAVLIMNPNNGEVLAMASSSVYDLNNPRDLSGIYSEAEIANMTDDEIITAYNAMWRNFTISDTYEPGSTVKTITLAAALEEGIVSDSDTFLCEGINYYANGLNKADEVKCNATHGLVDLKTSLAVSCNVAMMKIVERMGADNFVRYQQMFGFGQTTGIDLPGESSAEGMLYTAENMKPIDLGTNSFGQNYNVTMVQVAAAFSSLVNGGYYYKPHVVKEVVTEGGSTVDIIDKELVKTTVSQETSEWMKQALQMTVETGTATAGQIEGYAVGGKTGTAEKLPRNNGKHLVSYIAAAPIDDPEIVIYVLVDEPAIENQAAGAVIPTNIGTNILSEIFEYLQIFPEGDVDMPTGDGNGENGAGETTESTDEPDEDQSEEKKIQDYIGGNVAVPRDDNNNESNQNSTEGDPDGSSSTDEGSSTE